MCLGSMLFVLLCSLGGVVFSKAPFHRVYKPGILEIPLSIEGEYAISKNFYLNVDYVNSNLEIRTCTKNQIVWKNPPLSSFIGFEKTTTLTKEFNGMFVVNDNDVLSTCKNQRIDSILKENYEEDSITLTGVVTCGEKGKGGNHGYSMKILDCSSHLEITFNIFSPWNSIHFSFGTNFAKGSQIHGMGVQNTYFNIKGRQVENVVTEHGVGRGEQPITELVDTFQDRGGGNPTKSYSPIPFFVQHCYQDCSETWSTTGYWFKNFYDLSIFDFVNWEYNDIWIFDSQPANSNRTFTLNVYNGDSVKDVISTHVLEGLQAKSPLLPDWYHSGVIIGLQGGTQRVKSIVSSLLSANVPIAGIWLQDWSGQRSTGGNMKRLIWNWDLNTQHYPDWNSLVNYLKENNIRLLSYINPFLIDPPEKNDYKYNYWEVMMNTSCYIKNSSGHPYLFEKSFNSAILDLTSPICVNLTKIMIKRMLTLYNFDGYMLDFGEYTPVEDFKIFDMNQVHSIHNSYPELWQKVNREVVNEISDNNDIIFFTRSGYSYSPVYTMSMWAGDQLTQYDEFDGLTSAMITLLTSGISGLPNIHTDCGGYTSFQIKVPIKGKEITIYEVKRSKNLLWRWMEFSTFTLVFRTHEGMDPSDNFQVYTDNLTINFLCELGIVFQCLQPYRVNIMKQNQKDGVPIYRHLLLEYPDDSINGTEFGDSEYFFGSEFLVAPILEEGTKDKVVYFPEGNWVHVWTRQEFIGPSVFTFLDVNDGEIPVFFKKGSKIFQSDVFLECIEKRSVCT